MWTKDVVEDCLTININQLVREGLFNANAVTKAKCVWASQANALIEVNCNVTEHFVRLTYSWNEKQGKSEQVDYCVALTTTRPKFGGIRWWFICPLIVNKKPCGRRVVNLYLTRGTPYFGCRQCHDLTYTSAQESHKDEAFWRKIAEEEGYHWRKLRNLWTR